MVFFKLGNASLKLEASRLMKWEWSHVETVAACSPNQSRRILMSFIHQMEHGFCKM